MESSCLTLLGNKYVFYFLLPISVLISIFIFISQSISQPSPTITADLYSKDIPIPPTADPCTDRYIYVYDLPDRFHSGILRDCWKLCPWYNMCPYVANSGLGPTLTKTESESVLPETGWFVTDQWTLEPIFHNRMKQYNCLTTNYSQSTAVYIPYYMGLDIVRYLWGFNTTIRDSLSIELVQRLRSRPEWAAKGGKDHFIVAGRATLDFKRQSDEQSDWGGKFLLFPEANNLTILSAESSGWNSNEFTVPWPTYFHPTKESEVISWQEKVRVANRPYLFSFFGGRRPNQNATVRDLIIDQCARTSRCRLQECGSGKSECHSPGNIIRVYMSSKFCLQPLGDSFTRRSAFDSMLAGCVPIFFHPLSAHLQYQWYLPGNYSKYSVYIPENEVRGGKVNIEQVLLRYSEEQVRDMREEVIKSIPLIGYKDPRYKSESFRDAFDVAIDGVLERIRASNGNDEMRHS